MGSEELPRPAEADGGLVDPRGPAVVGPSTVRRDPGAGSDATDESPPAATLDAGAIHRPGEQLVTRRIRGRILMSDSQGRFYRLDGVAPRSVRRPARNGPSGSSGSIAPPAEPDGHVGAGGTHRAATPHAPPQILQQVAGCHLPDAPPISSPSSDAAAEELVALARSERLLGPLLATVDAGEIELSPRLVEQVVRSHHQAMRWCMHLERRLLDVADWLTAAGGVEFLVVKGPAVAHLDAGDASLRSFNDIDLLVHARDLDRAIACLVEHGAERRIPQRRPGFDRRFIKSIGLVCGDGVELDVHRSLTGGAHGFRIPLDRLFARPDRFDVGGTVFSAPNLTHRALHAAYHAIVGSNPPPLRTLRDLAGYMTSPALTPDVLVAEAGRWRGETVLAEAVRATFDAFSFSAPAWQAWLASVERDEAELAIIERGHHPAGRPVEWSTLRELGWRDRIAFTWAVANPSRETLEQRGLTRTIRLRHGARRLLRGGG